MTTGIILDLFSIAYMVTVVVVLLKILENTGDDDERK